MQYTSIYQDAYLPVLGVIDQYLCSAKKLILVLTTVMVIYWAPLEDIFYNTGHSCNIFLTFFVAGTLNFYEWRFLTSSLIGILQWLSQSRKENFCTFPQLSCYLVQVVQSESKRCLKYVEFYRWIFHCICSPRVSVNY